MRHDFGGCFGTAWGFPFRLWCRHNLRLRPFAKNDRPDGSRIRFRQPAPRCAVVGIQLVISPCRPDFVVAAILKHINPALDFYSPHGIGGVEVLPELAENGGSPNPNLGPMCLLLLR